MPIRKPPPTMQAPTSRKSFAIEAWAAENEGEKIVIYGPSGRGKTTLAALAPAPIFIGLDDGGRRIRHPETDEPVRRVTGVETFQDVRDALADTALWTEARSIIVDTATMLEFLAIQYVLDTVPHEKGHKVKRLEDYGYGKGYIHLFDAMRLLLSELDRHVRQGRNIVLLCQQCPIVVANPAGANFLENGPKLYAPGPEAKQSFTIRGYVCEWADHVLRLDYLSQQVAGGYRDKDGKEHAGKATGDTTRAVFSLATDPSFFAKSRTLREPVISFATPGDDSLWRILFPE